MPLEHPSLLRRAAAQRARSRAFTLIELLTVIAIIGILAAIIIPTVGKARAMAKKSQCVSNLRQWGTAVRLFANDSKGMVPLYNKDVDDWALYAPYFGQKFMVGANGQQELSQVALSRCPSAPTDTIQKRDYAFVKPTDSTKAKRGSEFGITDTNNINYYNLSDARTPSRLILMVEVYTGHNNEYLLAAPTDFGTTVRAMQINATNPSQVRHSGVANALYLDGHVGALGLGDTYSNDQPTRQIIARSMLLNN